MPPAMAREPMGSATMNPQAFMLSPRKLDIWTGGTTSKQYIDCLIARHAGPQAHLGEIHMCEHIVYGHFVGNEKTLMLEKLLIWLGIFTGLVPDHDAAVTGVRTAPVGWALRS